MSIFNKLFGSKNNHQPALQTRAQHKNEKYFRKEIARMNDWMRNDDENNNKYIKEHGSLQPIHYHSTLSLMNMIVEDMYSMGEPIERIYPEFMKTIPYFDKSWGDDFQGMALLVEMAAKSVLFDIPSDAFKVVADFMYKADESKTKEMWKPDSLVFYLIGDKEKQRKSRVPAFEKLVGITQLPKQEAEKKIKKYLDGWYEMHNDAPWYNTHEGSYGYSGYWAWEVAAVVKKMKLTDETFKNNRYYPYDLVHWHNNPGVVAPA